MQLSSRLGRYFAALVVFALANFAYGQTVTTLHNFSGNDGNEPSAGLIQGPDGTLYGGTLFGGTENYGVLYSLQTSGSGFDAFYSFCPSGGGACTTGSGVDGLSFAQVNGVQNIYGTTQSTVFSTPPAGPPTILSSVGDGTTPVPANDGNLYTLAPFSSEILRISPADGAVAQIATTTGFGLIGLVQAGDGNLYGTQLGGGTGTDNGNATIFKCTLSGTETVFYTFPSNLNPNGSLVVGADGQLYGFAADNSGNTAGQFYKLNITNATYTTLDTIANSYGIQTPGTPILASDGNFYATAGTSGDVSELVRITPSGTLTTVVDLAASGSFNGPPLQGNDGAFYVTAENGGSSSDGAVFRVVPATALPAPITMSLSKTSIVLGNSATLDWSVSGAYGDSATQCFATSTDTEWTGSQATSGSIPLTPSAVGQYRYGLTCGGTISSFVSLTVTSNGKVGTSTSLSVSPNPLTIGQTATLTATVTPQSGTTTPTGSVTFYADGSALTSVALNSSGVATISPPTTGYSAGTYSVTAEYTGSSAFNASTSSADSVTLTTKQSTTVTVTATPTSVVSGGDVSISAKVHTSGTGAATGTVTFTAAGETLASGVSLNSSGVATISGSSSGIPEGTYTLTVSYNGSSTLLASSGTTSVSVAWPTTTTISASPNPVTQGGTITLAAEVARTGNSGVPGGTVTFYADGRTVGSAALSGGSAILSAPLPSGTAQGTYSVTATYGGDPLDGTSSSNAINVTVN